MRTSCITVCSHTLGNFLHYDEYRHVHYEANYVHHVCYDDMTVTIPSRCPAITRQQVLARPAGPGGVRAHLVGHIRTCGLCVEKHYTSNLARTEKPPKRMK